MRNASSATPKTPMSLMFIIAMICVNIFMWTPFNTCNAAEPTMSFQQEKVKLLNSISALKNTISKVNMDGLDFSKEKFIQLLTRTEILLKKATDNSDDVLHTTTDSLHTSHATLINAIGAVNLSLGELNLAQLERIAYTSLQIYKEKQLTIKNGIATMQKSLNVLKISGAKLATELTDFPLVSFNQNITDAEVILQESDLDLQRLEDALDYVTANSEILSYYKAELITKFQAETRKSLDLCEQAINQLVRQDANFAQDVFYEKLATAQGLLSESDGDGNKFIKAKRYISLLQDELIIALNNK